MRRASILLILISLITITSKAFALTTFEGDIVGSWRNVQKDSSDYTYIYNWDTTTGEYAYFFFGYPVNTNTDYSKLVFDGRGSDSATPSWVGQDDGNAFLIGEFCYFNGINYAWSVDGIQSVDLRLNIEITDPVSLLNQTFDYGFNFDLTNNYTGGTRTDADAVTAPTNPWSSTFMYNGAEFTLDILGFSSDGGSTFTSELSCGENCGRAYGLYASITGSGEPPPVVPEPTSLLLLGSGLLGMIRYRKKIF